MDVRLLWKLQTIRHGRQVLDHLERPVELWRKLGRPGRGDLGGGAVMKTQPHPAADHELKVTSALVVVLLHSVLSEKEVIPYLGKEDITFLELTSPACKRGEPEGPVHTPPETK